MPWPEHPVVLTLAVIEAAFGGPLPKETILSAYEGEGGSWVTVDHPDGRSLSFNDRDGTIG